MISFLELNTNIIYLLDLSLNYGFGILPLQQILMIWKKLVNGRLK